MTRIVVVSAGLSDPSSSRLLADQLGAATATQLRDRDTPAEVRVIELRAHAHDIVNHLLTGFPPAALRDTLDAVTGADGLIVVTPIFTASYSGLFKSFFDVLEHGALAGKPVLIAATGGTARHSLALEFAVRPLMAHLRAAVVPTAVFAAAEDWSGQDRTVQDRAVQDRAAGEAPLRARITRAAGELAELVLHRPAPAPVDSFALTTTFEQILAADEHAA